MHDIKIVFYFQYFSWIYAYMLYNVYIIFLVGGRRSLAEKDPMSEMSGVLGNK